MIGKRLSCTIAVAFPYLKYLASYNMMRDIHEQQALISLCMNNAGVEAFERGHLVKALKFFQVALHPMVKSSMAIESQVKLSKTILMKAIKNQSKIFARNQGFDITYSETFGRHSRQTRRQKLVIQRCDDSSTYVFQRVVSIKVSNSVTILEQTTSDLMNAVILINLGICHHLSQERFEYVKRYYELAIQFSWEYESKIIQVLCWNNLLHISSNELLDEELARYCLNEIEQVLVERKKFDRFSSLKRADRDGILFNLLLLSNSGSLAAAA
jgi:hypothetical protein